MKDYKRIFETIVNNTEKYLQDAGIKTMILGISGGLDSTVVAAVCYEVSKRHRDMTFMGISLPCSTNTYEENDNARLTMHNFCDVIHTENIQSMYDKVHEVCSNFGDNGTTVSQGNIKARLRMIYLYNLASIHNGIVMDTDNLTEHYLGFFTIHGDVADLNPIGKLWKTEVYELAKYLTERYADDKGKIDALMGAINIVPTDGNGVKEGGDLAQIMPGYTYTEVDKVLKFWIEEMGGCADQHDIDKFLKENPEIEPNAFLRVIKRHLATGFKRKHAPIVIKIQ